MREERFLVTGGTGCIGAWVVRGLVREGVPVTVVSSSGSAARLRLILSDDELALVSLQAADVCDIGAVEAIARWAGVNRIVHLAALQLPFCAAVPNGSVDVFEIAKPVSNPAWLVTYGNSRFVRQT